MLIRNGIPLYLQLKEKLLEDIKNNYKANDTIPAEGQIEKKYNVSRITVRKAIEELEKEEIVQKRQGIGTFVKEQKIAYDANYIASLTQRLAKQNLQLKTKSIFFEIIEENHFVKNLLKCESLLCIKRIRLLNETPFALMVNYFDINKVPNIDKKFKIESLYSFLKQEYDIELYSAEETIEAIPASKNQALQLDVKEEYPLLSLKRLSFDKDKNPVEYSNLVIKSNMYEHKIKLGTDKR